MADFKVNWTQPRMYQITGGKLIEGYETEFLLTEFGTVHTVKTPTDNPDVVRKAIMEKIDNVRSIHALGEE